MKIREFVQKYNEKNFYGSIKFVANMFEWLTFILTVKYDKIIPKKTKSLFTRQY